MAKDYQIDETNTELILHIPPPNVIWKTVASTVAASTSLWCGFMSFYLWLARSESNLAFLYCITANALFAVTVHALRVLYRQSSKKEITFERHVSGIDYRILGVRVQRRWFSVHGVQQWVMEPRTNGRKLMVAMQYRDCTVVLADTLDADLWLSLLIRMQRKNFVYV